MTPTITARTIKEPWPHFFPYQRSRECHSWFFPQRLINSRYSERWGQSAQPRSGPGEAMFELVWRLQGRRSTGVSYPTWCAEESPPGGRGSWWSRPTVCTAKGKSAAAGNSPTQELSPTFSGSCDRWQLTRPLLRFLSRSLSLTSGWMWVSVYLWRTDIASQTLGDTFRPIFTKHYAAGGVLQPHAVLSGGHVFKIFIETVLT